jgi:hypothetical protein
VNAWPRRRPAPGGRPDDGAPHRRVRPLGDQHRLHHRLPRRIGRRPGGRRSPRWRWRRGIGAIIDQPQPFGIAGSFFGEDQGLYVVTVRDEALADFLVAADKAGLVADPIGRTIKDRIIFELEDGDFCVSLTDLKAAHEAFFPQLMGADAALA